MNKRPAGVTTPRKRPTAPHAAPDSPASDDKVTHAALVKRAATWLKNYERCSLVVTELRTGAPEVPDAIGWRDYASVLIECKTSRSDFLRDHKKWHRGHVLDMGMGMYRYYLTLPGIVKDKSELPKDWGLLELHGRSVRVILASTPSGLECDRRKHEFTMLLSLIRRQGILSSKGT